MKRILFLSGLVLMALSFGCNGVKKVADINVDIPYGQQFSVPTIAGDTAGQVLPAGGLSVAFPAVPLATQAASQASSYGTSVNKITSITLTAMTLQISAPPSQNFDFLDSVQVYISANSQPEMLVAYASGVPKGQSTLPLTTVQGLNLKNYFIQDTLYFRMSSHINAIPASGTSLNLATVFHMVANPLN